MASQPIPIPAGATLQPLQSLPIPQGATLQPLSQDRSVPTLTNQQPKKESLLTQIGGAVGDQLQATGATIYNQFRHPIDNSFPVMAYNSAKAGIENIDKTPGEQLSGMAGQVGVDIPGAKQAYQEGNIPSAIQKVVNPVAQALILKKAVEVVPTAGAYISSKMNAMKTAPQVNTVPGMAQMAPHEIGGLEDIYRAAAPTAKNPGFRANLNAALPDLKAVAQDLNLKEAKGGIINPDMRVRATVDAINGRLDSIAQNERVAQIQRNAGTPVEIKLNTDARRGMEFLANNAGEAGTQQLASSALKRGTIPIEQADVLAQSANKYLKSYEKLTPDQKLSATVTNPKIGGLKELDRALGNSLNNTLTSKGEVGLRDYERRYAGLSAVRDALQDRMNAAELDQPGLVKGLIRPVANTLMKGKTGIASASQAAVADIRTGKALQSGFKKLSSGQ